MFTSAGPAMAAVVAKRRFEDDAAEVEVELTLKRKKQRILPIRTITTTFYHDAHYSLRHHPAPEDSPIIFHPDPPTLTPAESDEGDAEACLFQTTTPPDIPAISAQGLLARPCEDLDMDDSSPLPTPARPELLSPLNVSNRLPTPRYGSFFLRPPAQHAGCDVTMNGVEEGIIRAMGMSSLNPVTENRILPSPINESVPRRSIDYDRDDTAMEMMTPRRPGASEKKEDRRSGAGKPMLVMGYRADCEKCRARVPGHYSHILRS